MTMNEAKRSPAFARSTRWLRLAESIIYIAVGIVLVAAAGTLLTSAVLSFVRTALTETRASVLQMLDSLLLVLMLVEVLHTVGYSLRSHELVPEPFLIVGLISAIRRVLVITAEQQPGTTDPTLFQNTMLELGLLTITIIVLVVAIFLLRRQAAHAAHT